MFGFSLPRALREIRSLSQFLPRTLLAILCATPYAGAAFNVQLAWDADSDPSVVGYRLHWTDSVGDPEQVLDTGNTTTATATALQSGVTYNFTVTAYNSDGLESAPSNMVVVQDSGVPNQPPTVTLVNPADGTTATAPAGFVITANASDSDGTVAHVEFYSNGVLLGDIQASPYSFDWQSVDAGTYSLTARAYDDAGAATTSGAVNVVVNPANEAPFVYLTGLGDGTVFNAPAIVAVSANASDSDGTIARVEFYANGSKIGESATSPYTINWQNPAPGRYGITARAYDNLGAVATSAGVNIFVNAPPTVTLTSPGDGSTFSPGNLSLAADASDSDGSVVRVEFYSNGGIVGQASASPFAFNWQNVAPGTYNVFARAWDDQGALTSSQIISITVSDQAQAPAITAVTYDATGCQLVITGAAGGSENVYASSDLKTWTLLMTLTNSSGTVLATDSGATSISTRFYRATDNGGTSDPAGFMKVVLPAGNKRHPIDSSYLGFALTWPIAARGTITSAGDHTISDSQSVWTDNQFNGVSGDFYVELVSGPCAGFMSDIVGTDSASHSITLEDDLSPILSGGEKYAIRKHRTLADTFGLHNEAGLKGGGTASLADQVEVFNPVAQSYDAYYYQTGSAVGGTGWRSSTDAATDVSATKLYLDQGVLVSRTIGSQMTLAVTGAVKMGPTMIPIGQNKNLVANVYAAGSVTLDNSGLFTGDAGTGLGGGASVTTADEVQIYNGSSFVRYYYQVSGGGGVGWRREGNFKSNAGSTQIAPGSAVCIVRKSGRPAFNWTVPQPF